MRIFRFRRREAPTTDELIGLARNLTNEEVYALSASRDPATAGTASGPASGNSSTMDHVIHTDELLPWARRVGGGYARRYDACLAAEFVNFPVLVGPADDGKHFILVPNTHPEGDTR